MENTRHHTCLRAHAKTHVNVADLRHRGESDHPADVILLDGGEGAEDHAHQTEYKENVDNSCAVKDVKTDDTVNNFNQQKDITLGHQTGEDRSGRYCGVSVGVRQPRMEREQRALDAQTDTHERHRDNQGNLVFAVCDQKPYRLLDVAH